MSSFTSLSVNKNSTRFAPKVKARPGARRSNKEKEKDNQEITSQRRSSIISKPTQATTSTADNNITKQKEKIDNNNNGFHQEAPSTPIPTKKTISHSMIDSINHKEMINTTKQNQSSSPIIKTNVPPRLTSIINTNSMNDNNNNNISSTSSNDNNNIKKSKNLNALKEAMNKSIIKNDSSNNTTTTTIPAIKSSTPLNKTKSTIGKKISTPGSNGISFSVPSNNHNNKSMPPSVISKSIPITSTSLSSIKKSTPIESPSIKKSSTSMNKEKKADIKLETFELSELKGMEEDDMDNNNNNNKNEKVTNKRKLQDIQNKSREKRISSRKRNLKGKSSTSSSSLKLEEITEHELITDSTSSENETSSDDSDDEDQTYESEKEKRLKKKLKLKKATPTTKKTKITKPKSNKKKKGESITTTTSSDNENENENQLNKTKKNQKEKKKKTVKQMMKVKDMKTLEDINYDPLQVEDLDKPVSYFIRDLQRGIVTKSYRDERILHEEELAKKSNNEEEAKLLQKRREESERLNEQKRLKLEQEKEKQYMEQREAAKHGLTESQHAVQVRLVDGKIVLDKDSMLIDRREEHEKISHEHMEVIEENSNSRKVNAYTYGKKAKSVRWTKPETDLFYELLSQFGTDFQMISKMLPNRTRAQLRSKFIREEREFPEKITDHLIRKREPVNLEKFKSVTGLEFEDIPDHFHDIKII